MKTELLLVWLLMSVLIAPNALAQNADVGIRGAWAEHVAFSAGFELRAMLDSTGKHVGFSYDHQFISGGGSARRFRLSFVSELGDILARGYGTRLDYDIQDDGVYFGPVLRIVIIDATPGAPVREFENEVNAFGGGFVFGIWKGGGALRWFGEFEVTWGRFQMWSLATGMRLRF